MRLLLAEDERSLSRAVTVLLRKNNYEVDPVYDGEEALDYLGSGNYDGAILDIMMPKRDGIDVLRQLRQRGSRLPVLLLTAKSEVDDKVLGLDSGANDYLTKPFASQELLARIRAMTREQTEQATSLLRVGNITLDRATFELSSPTGHLRLTNKEFQVLELLMCNPHNLISTQRFLEKIWGYDNEAEINVVWVYISYLRKKLAALHADIQIKARRNAGYYPQTAHPAGGGLYALPAAGDRGDSGGGAGHQLPGGGLRRRPGAGPAGGERRRISRAQGGL